MSWVEDELREQPAALERFLARERDEVLGHAHELMRRDVRYLFIASRGSSANAARYAQYVFGAFNRLPVAFSTPSLYTLYDAPPRLDGALAVAISQSGESPDVVSVLAEAKLQQRPTIAITNEPESPLAEQADWVVPLQAGTERAVAATKTYLNSVAAVALLSAALARDEARLDSLQAIPAAVTEQVERSLSAAADFDRYAGSDGGVVVARGLNLGTAFEIALKIRELSGIPYEPFSSADLLHGPIAALLPGRPVLVVAPSGPALASVRDSLAKLRERGASVVAISDDAGVLAAADVALPLARTVPEWLSPLTTVVPGQVAAIRLATLRGGDIDRPAGLTKVTLTR
ncbi:MAG: SIS domain-containing protein [Gaiellaceae bacterium]|jgi:glucosamine--fructose-6-phosphate aminotransferase (isomerizing)